MAERLQKYLARCGVASRRACERLIESRRVKVNGRVVTLQGTVVEPGRDHVEVDGRVISAPAHLRHLALHKPPGVLSAASDPRGRRTVLDLIPGDRRLFPVGRLDIASEGLIVLTDDGDLALRLTHPRHGVDKEYRVLLGGKADDAALLRWGDGVVLDGVLTKPVRLEDLESITGGRWVRVVLQDGRYRVVRRMAEAVGLRVERLIRVRIGSLHLGSLAPSKWRPLLRGEVDALRAASGRAIP